MNKTVLLATITAVTFLQVVSFASAWTSTATVCPQEGGASIGTISYTNPSTGENFDICVNSAGFDLLGKRGTLDPTNGVISYGGESRYYNDIPGINSYTPAGKATVTVNSPAPDVSVKGGTIWYINPTTKVPSEIIVNNDGSFKLDNKIGTIAKTASGLFMVHYDGQVAELRNIAGVNTYQLEGGSPVAVKYGTTGTVYGTGNVLIKVVNGEFTFKGYKGQLEINGDYVMENGVMGNILTTDGVIGYQLAGGPYIPVVVGTTGTITYKGKSYPVINGNFTLDNGTTGSLVPVNGVYDGSYKLANSSTIYNLTTTAGVEGYQIAGKPYLSLNANGTQSLKVWLSLHSNENFVKDPWGHNAGVNDAMMRAWLTANPNLSATQILDDMATYKIDIRQFIAAKFYTDSTAGFTSASDSAKVVAGSAMNFIGSGSKQWNDAMQWFYDRGITNHELVTRGVLQIGGPGSTMAAGLGSACWYGIVRLGVCFASQYGLHPGVSRTDEQVYYSQKDLDEARGYEANGYWPDGTGYLDNTLIKKYGSVAAADKACPHACYDRTISGPDIADPKMYGLLPNTATSATVPPSTINTSGTTVLTTNSTVSAQDPELAPSGSQSCADFTVGFGYRAKDTATNDDVTVLQDFLHTNGYLVSTPTGFFGAGTVKAVKAFQKAYNISQTGYLGPNTRAKIKAIDCQ